MDQPHPPRNGQVTRSTARAFGKWPWVVISETVFSFEHFKVSKIYKFKEFSTEDYSSGQSQKFNDFYSKLTSTLDVEGTTLSLCQLWKDNPPPEAEGKSLEGFLGTVSRIAEQRHLLSLILPQAASIVNLYDSYAKYCKYAEDCREHMPSEKFIHELKLENRWQAHYSYCEVMFYWLGFPVKSWSSLRSGLKKKSCHWTLPDVPSY